MCDRDDGARPVVGTELRDEKTDGEQSPASTKRKVFDPRAISLPDDEKRHGKDQRQQRR